MGIFDEFKADADSSRNRDNAKKKVESEKNNIISELSKYGDVMEFDNHKELIGEFCNEAAEKVLGYEYYSLDQWYLKYNINTERYDYVSSYSGKVDSSGNIKDLTPNYSSGYYTTIEEGDGNYTDKFFLKVVERGKKQEVEKLEKKFFANEGKLYLNIKAVDEKYYDEEDSLKGCLKNFIKARRNFSIASLIFTIVCLVYLYYGLVKNEDSEGFQIAGIWAFTISIIAYIVCAVKLHRAKDGVSFDIRDHMCMGFVFLQVCVGIAFLSVAFVIETVALFIAIVDVIISFIFFVRCFRSNDKNKSSRLLYLINNREELAELDKLAEKIRSYSVKL